MSVGNPSRRASALVQHPRYSFNRVPRSLACRTPGLLSGNGPLPGLPPAMRPPRLVMARRVFTINRSMHNRERDARNMVRDECLAAKLNIPYGWNDSCLAGISSVAVQRRLRL